MESNVAGPGAVVEETISPKPLLDGASEYEYVEIKNPLTVDFVGLVGVTRPANTPMRIGDPTNPQGVTASEEELRRTYGLNLRNNDFTGRVNIQNKITIPAGKTLRILGNEAQVILRQLVNEVMSRTGQKKLLADAAARRRTEEQLVISRGSVSELMGSRPQTIQEQLTNAIKEPDDDFPGIKEDPSGSGAGGGQSSSSPSGVADTTAEDSVPAKRPPGRPRKTSAA